MLSSSPRPHARSDDCRSQQLLTNASRYRVRSLARPYVGAVDSGEDKPPRGADRRLLLVGAGTALALMVLIVVTTASRTPILQSPDRDPNLHIRYGRLPPPSSSPSSNSGATGTRKPSPDSISNTLGNIIVTVVLLLLLLVVLWLIIAIVLAAVRRWRQRRRAKHAGPLPGVDDAVLDAVVEAAGRQQQRILEGAPSNAVVACWVDLEQAVAHVGVERRPSETSAELTIRVLDALDVDRRALRTLAALYREARYSAHALTEQDRASAQQALAALHRSLLAATRERV